MKPIQLVYREGETSFEVTLIDKPSYIDYVDLAQQLYSLLPRTTNMTDIFVIRPPVDEQVQDPKNLVNAIRPFLDRMPNAQIYTLTSNNFEIQLSHNMNSHSGNLPAGPEKFLKWLQEHELRHYVKISNALFSEEKNMCYLSPSGKYVRNFLRVGSIQTSRRVLNAIFFWTIPYLKGCTGIICETWSISSIAINMARLLDRYIAGRGAECTVDMLSQYHDGFSGTDENIEDSFRQVEKSNGSVLILISCVMTGGSLNALRDTINSYPLSKKPDFLALYKLNSFVDVPSLCELFGREGDPDFSPIAKKSSEDTVISIDRQTYFPLKIVENSLTIRRAEINPARQFFERYRGFKSVNIHRTALDMNSSPIRHHGLYLDVLGLLESDEFRRRINENLSKISAKPDVILCPPHNAGKKLKDYAFAQLNLDAEKVIDLVTPDLELSVSTDAFERISGLSSDKTILIVDDVSVSGKRLARYQRRLRELRFQGRICYLIGVARPESEARWKQRLRELCHREEYELQHQVFAAETVFLPDWNAHSCPWCEELRVLEKSREQLGESLDDLSRSILETRIRLLSTVKDAEGLLDDVFWTIRGPIRLTENSLFIKESNTTQADVVSVVSAAIQMLRINGINGRKLQVAFPTANVLDPKTYLGTTFTDFILRASIIRGSVRSELDVWSEKERMWRQNAFSNIVLDDGEGNILLELAVSVLLRRLPPAILSNSDKARIASTSAGNLFVRLLENAKLLQLVDS